MIYMINKYVGIKTFSFKRGVNGFIQKTKYQENPT